MSLSKTLYPLLSTGSNQETCRYDFIYWDINTLVRHSINALIYIKTALMIIKMLIIEYKYYIFVQGPSISGVVMH